MDYVKNCGYDNFSLSRGVVARGFLFEKHSSQYVGNVGIYSVVETWCIRYDKLAKQNVSRVSCGKALLRDTHEN